MQWRVSWDSRQGNCNLGMLCAERTCPAALMRKWTHASLHPGLHPKAQLWAALWPFTRHGLRQALGRTRRTVLLKCFSFFFCLSRVINFKSLFYTGLYHVFGVHSIIEHLFSQKPLRLQGSFPQPRPLQAGGSSAGWWVQPSSSSSGEAATQPHSIQAIYLKCQLYVG